MEQQLSPIEWLLNSIDQCNQELRDLNEDTEKANQKVSGRPWVNSDQWEITYKNKIQLQRDDYFYRLKDYLEPYNLGLRSNAYPKNTNKEGLKYLAFIDILGFSDIEAV